MAVTSVPRARCCNKTLPGEGDVLANTMEHHKLTAMQPLLRQPSVEQSASKQRRAPHLITMRARIFRCSCPSQPRFGRLALQIHTPRALVGLHHHRSCDCSLRSRKHASHAHGAIPPTYTLTPLRRVPNGLAEPHKPCGIANSCRYSP